MVQKQQEFSPSIIIHKQLLIIHPHKIGSKKKKKNSHRHHSQTTLIIHPHKIVPKNKRILTIIIWQL
jgi:hypothetical protein